jgi:acyl-coenzyme A synthetase/AMP-(fatty) acid ligase
VPELFNLASYFVDRHVAEGRGGRTAIVCDGRRYTYAEIAALVNRAGNAFRRAGVLPGDRVLIVVADGAEFVAAFFGAIKIGAVAVPTSTALRPADYAYLLEASQAKLVVGEEGIPGLESCGPELECAPTSADDAAYSGAGKREPRHAVLLRAYAFRGHAAGDRRGQPV